MANDLDAKFKDAADQAKSLKERPSNDDMLLLYALYKQSTSGDVSGSRPGVFDLVGKAKYDAWEAQKGVKQEAAKKAYIKLVDSLK